ncbi:MAG: cyclase family protein [Bryobacteraceae bacterium]
MLRYVEVSHRIEMGMKTYPGLPEPSAEVLLDYDASQARYQGKAEFLIASLHLCGNTGTYVDSPRHRHRAGADLAGIPLESVAHVPVTKIDLRAHAGREVGMDAFKGVDLAGRAVLINTGWSRHWQTDAYFEKNPFLTASACEFLAASGVRFVGIDSLNIDDIDDLSRPAHTILLGAGIPVCEHMTNLHALAPEGGFLHAVPIAWVGGATFPVRAYVVYSSSTL